MQLQVQNQIRILRKPVAAEVARRREAHRRWLWLGPIDHVVKLVEVEVPADLDPVDFPSTDEDYVVVSTEAFSSLDAALVALEGRGIDTDSFDAVWKFENPF